MKKCSFNVFKRVLLTVCSVSILMMCFVFSSSGATYDDTGIGTVPIEYIHQSSVNASDTPAHSISVGNRDRVAFSCFTNGGVWHCIPFVMGKQSTSDIVTSINDNLLGGQKKFTRVATLASNGWEFNTEAPVSPYTSEVLTARYTSETVQTVYATGRQSWVPEYRIRYFFVNGHGEQINKDVPVGSLSVRSGFVFAVDQNKPLFSQVYPVIDLGQFNGYDRSVAGIRVVVEERYYNINGVVASNDYSANNLYTNMSLNYPLLLNTYNLYFDWFETNQKLYSDGYNAGYSNGESAGYSKGVREGANYNAVSGILTLAQAPGVFINGMLDFEVFDINLAQTVKVFFTTIVVAFVVVVVLRFIF